MSTCPFKKAIIKYRKDGFLVQAEETKLGYHITAFPNNMGIASKLPHLGDDLAWQRTQGGDGAIRYIVVSKKSQERIKQGDKQ